MFRLVLALMLALAAPAASLAQPTPARADLWRRGEDRISFTTARFSFPDRAGAVSLNGASEFSHAGEGLDNILQYQDPAGEVFATIYIYYPGLAHSGLTALMTDSVIHTQSGPDLRELGRRVVAAGGRGDAAIRADYAGFRHALASSAAFIKAGRWMMKLRVSGPDARRAEVEATMTALLDGIRFEGEIQARPATPLQIEECRDAVPPARALPSDEGNFTEHSILATFDPAGEEARDEHGRRTEPLLARLGVRWCRTRVPNGNETRLILRAVSDGSAGGLGGRTVIVVPVNDAGTTLELVETSRSGRFVLLYHVIGRSLVLGAYDAPLSDEQIAGILNGSDREGTQIRASVQHLPNGNSNINLPAPSSEPTAPPPI